MNGKFINSAAFLSRRTYFTSEERVSSVIYCDSVLHIAASVM
jgi:hypothetical protein